jgi:hypothetical protein
VTQVEKPPKQKKLEWGAQVWEGQVLGRATRPVWLGHGATVCRSPRANGY